MIHLLTDPLYAFCTLLILSYFMYLFFTYVFPLNKKQWKKMDYVWLSLSSIAIFGIVESNRIEIAEGELNRTQWLIESDSAQIIDHLKVNYVCNKYVKSEYSPDNFEELQIMTDVICKWTKEVKPKVSVLIKNRKLIENLKIPHVKDDILEDYTSQFSVYVNEYNKKVITIRELEIKSKESEISKAIQLFSPLLLIIGLSIRFSKTAAEIRLN